MKKASKIGYIVGVNTYESEMLKNAIEYYIRDKYKAESHIITASDDMILRYKNAALSDEHPDELTELLREQVKELVAKGAEYIVAPISASRGLGATEYIFDGLENVKFLNNYRYRLYLSLAPLLAGSRSGLEVRFLGPTEEIRDLDFYACMCAKDGGDLLTSVLIGDINNELGESLISETEEGLYVKISHAITKTYKCFSFCHLAVTDFWTERLLLGGERLTFDNSNYNFTPYNYVTGRRDSSFKPEIFQPKVYNLALIFAKFVAWYSTRQVNRRKQELKLNSSRYEMSIK